MSRGGKVSPAWLATLHATVGAHPGITYAEAAEKTGHSIHHVRQGATALRNAGALVRAETLVPRPVSRAVLARLQACIVETYAFACDRMGTFRDYADDAGIARPTAHSRIAALRHAGGLFPPDCLFTIEGFEAMQDAAWPALKPDPALRAFARDNPRRLAVLQAVRAHGSNGATSADVAADVGLLSAGNASRVLRALLADGEVVVRGRACCGRGPSRPLYVARSAA